MATIYTIHPTTPQVRLLQQIGSALQAGAVMLYPTDTSYAIGCDLRAKDALQRVRHLKQLATGKPLTFLCPSLAGIAQYAQVSDSNYRLMRSLVPGPYTFILPATKLVPQLVLNPKRKTTGIRVPDHPLCQAILALLANPIISTSARLPGEDETTLTPLERGLSRVELFDRLDRMVDLIVDDGSEVLDQVSTILDLTEPQPQVLRRGLGYERVAHWEEDSGILGRT
ncbi:L-threonylcarbamoyladenylate synthase [Candidatus Cyanaurora vandensis]|uniref:L-threonylcarbamoyladenylate synthase n=1 Tax=Candidatus Cyanaurora vandensis TaxID=2714958 RepID=UPI00257EB220|nr:L-threonylcarbamoyladenylate synthase [Candidatus Cyanaurora vandensis]